MEEVPAKAEERLKDGVSSPATIAHDALPICSSRLLSIIEIRFLKYNRTQKYTAVTPLNSTSIRKG